MMTPQVAQRSHCWRSAKPLGQLIGCTGKQTVPSLGAEPLGRSKLLLPSAAASKHPRCYGLPRFEVTSSTAKRTVKNPFYCPIWMVRSGFGKIACSQSLIARITSVSKVGGWLMLAYSFLILITAGDCILPVRLFHFGWCCILELKHSSRSLGDKLLAWNFVR